MKKKLFVFGYCFSMVMLSACSKEDGDAGGDGMKLADGTAVTVEQDGMYSIYKLEDGTELLKERAMVGPENSKASHTDGFADLGEDAQKTVSEFYEELAPYYDVSQALEDAYAEYQGDQESFEADTVGQHVIPLESNEEIMYFMTDVDLPEKMSVCHAFKRETGENISNYELFSCGESEIVERLFAIAGKEDEVLKEEMKAALKPEYLVFDFEYLILMFPAGVLASEADGYNLGVEYVKLGELLYEWAVPEM